MTDASTRARGILYDTATAKAGWESPEPKAIFTAATAVAAMLAYADERAAEARAEGLEEAAVIVDATSRALNTSSRAAYKDGNRELAQRFRAEEVCRNALSSAIRARITRTPDNA